MLSSLFTVPLKITQSIVDFIKPISSYIKNTFPTQVLNENKDSLAELNQLRENALVRLLDKHETSLETLRRYYDQLINIEKKLPISENQIRVSFNWYDAFGEGSKLEKYSFSGGQYERFYLLFNISGLLSQIACSQNLTTDEGLKTAAKNYQQSAGILTYLKENVYSVFQTLPPPEFSVGCLTTLSTIMLAQAQDCFFIKAKADNMKEALLAKIAMQAVDHYQEAHRVVTFYEVKELWDKQWIPTLQCKYSYFVAVAEMYYASTAAATGNYGEQFARLRNASKYISDAIKQGGQYTPADVKTIEGEIKRLSESPKKENELLYLYSVPKLDALSVMQRAKPTPFTSLMSSNFKNLFRKLVPIELMQGLPAYESAKYAVVGSERMKLGEAKQFVNGVMVSSKLPAAIENLTGQNCPQWLKDRANEIKEKVCLSSIDHMMEDLPYLLNRNKKIIDEIFRMLDEEERGDTLMRENFKERWVRTPSNKLTKLLYMEGYKYGGVLNKAKSADLLVKSKYDANRISFEILSKTGDEIASQLPKGEVNLSDAGADVLQELCCYMTEVEQLKKQMDELIESLKSATMDMQSKFPQAFASECLLETDPSRNISNKNLDALYAQIRMSIAENITNQKQLVEKIQRANEQFNAAKRSSGNVNPRDQMLKELATAYIEVIALSANLTEGSKFYNDFTQALLKYRGKVTDFVLARKTEKDELSFDLLQQEAKGKSARKTRPITSNSGSPSTLFTTKHQGSSQPYLSQQPSGPIPIDYYASLQQGDLKQKAAKDIGDRKLKTRPITSTDGSRSTLFTTTKPGSSQPYLAQQPYGPIPVDYYASLQKTRPITSTSGSLSNPSTSSNPASSYPYL